MRAFFDTNVLIYLNSPSERYFHKACHLLDLGGVISVQVLNEYCSVSLRKYKRDWSTILKACEDFERALEVCDLTLESQTLARAYVGRYGYSIYDANIIASAKLAGCDTLWSEDMADGQIIEGVRITNPFAAES
jgi:L-asparaginase / beta-aspartyl-peptidase